MFGKRIVLVCALASIILLGVRCDDSDDSQNNAVTGNWRVMSVILSGQSIGFQTPDAEVISIVFESSGDYSGTTTANTFGGNYELTGSTLTLTSFTTTEVADTPFAGAFYNAISEAIVPNTTYAEFDFSVAADTLMLGFADSGTMRLQRP
ncbi:META domain-containing protein [Allomuricauda sp. SCSIO 65647]|uniref:META domain-containing protein n=1 Tax=Allomuricauda sp. SCSIO 65647 TaxID=2908843 RepID=UPI001F40D347|nr:META domain-containing protein [Muricauda sp. SCSIO 65647]UJH68910.1 META domain-containing protein [Muricauda sp. SCSIO 65647]